MDILAGECVAIVGKSGSGKSTLLNLICGIDTPSNGELLVDGAAIHQQSQEQLAHWRGRRVGVVFQFYQLLPTLTTLENVMLPMDFCHTYPARERVARAHSLLAQVGIADQAGKFPSDMSGGQQQRAAIARAMANNPPLIVADEPTGNLDSVTSNEVMNLFAGLAAAGKTVIIVTHERGHQQHFTRSITLIDGQIASDDAVPKRTLRCVE
jgi:putative ABC transport system ATP-binding protein